MKRLFALLPRRVRREDGQATFEFALLIPFLVIAVLFVVDGGIWMYKFVTVSSAVRDAARYGSVNCGGTSPCDNAEIIDRAVQSSSGFLDSVSDDWTGTGWVDRSGTPSEYERGDSIVVRVHHDHGLLFFPFSFGVSSCAELRLESDNGDGDVVSSTGGC